MKQEKKKTASRGEEKPVESFPKTTENNKV
jgi:hypothetical protein